MPSDQKISDLSTDPSLNITDYVPVVTPGIGQTRKASIADILALGSVAGNTAATIVFGSPFAVYNGDTSFSISGANTVITDTRLVGKSGYAVTTNEINLYEFTRDELVYDSVNGKVTILNYILPTGNCCIRVYADVYVSAGSGASSATITTMQGQIAALQTAETALATAVSSNTTAINALNGLNPLKLASGTLTIGDVPAHGQTYTVTFGTPLATANYMVLFTVVSLSSDAEADGLLDPVIRGKTTTNFTFYLNEPGPSTQNINIDWMIISF